ncbi:GroES-like protein [Atractiella rhizophila]|nr:GroES-like protein [Atractiella rhizophila]
MSPIPNPRLYLKKPVEANTYPVPNENLAYDDKETIDIDGIELKPGELLVETLCVSLDPYMRGRMRKDGESYAEPFTVGDPITGAMIGKVLKSSSEKFQEGHLVNFGGREIKHKHEELFWKTIPDKLVAGEIQFQESVYHGFSKAPEAFDDLMKGKNEGKVIVML